MYYIILMNMDTVSKTHNSKCIQTNDALRDIVNKCKKFTDDYLLSQFNNVTDRSLVTLSVYTTKGEQSYNRIVALPKHIKHAL